MKEKITLHLDQWADSKTQDEFNDWVLTWIVLPVLIPVFILCSVVM